MNTTKRKWLPRREWAAMEAGKRRQQASALRDQRIPSGNWRGVRRKMDALARLEREVARLEMIAAPEPEEFDLPF